MTIPELKNINSFKLLNTKINTKIKEIALLIKKNSKSNLVKRLQTLQLVIESFIERNKYIYVENNSNYYRSLFCYIPCFYSNMKLSLFEREISTIKQIMISMGFAFIEGESIVRQVDNFDNLNIRNNHPAKSEQQSMLIDKTWMLASQMTSAHSNQSLYKKNISRYFIIGKTFRNDNDRTHLPEFHQMDWLIKEDITQQEFKNKILFFLRKYFDNNKIDAIFRPSYFPFTYMSFDVEMIMNNKRYEIAGGGTMHPRILINQKITNPFLCNWQACGIGIERLIMIKYELEKIHDVHSFINAN